MATIKVFVRGKGMVKLSEEGDYVADGGEGRIYAKGATMYKIYHDPANMIPEAKIAELAALDHPNIVRPKARVIAPSRILRNWMNTASSTANTTIASACSSALKTTSTTV